MRDARQDAAKEAEIRAMYQAAKDDESVKEAAKKAMAELNAAQKEVEDESYWFMFRLFEDMHECNNDKIRIREPYQYKDVERLVFWLRCHEVHEFVFSSGWSSAMDSIWELTQAGCTMAGMVEINSSYTNLEGEVEKDHGILFTL